MFNTLTYLTATSTIYETNLYQLRFKIDFLHHCVRSHNVLCTLSQQPFETKLFERTMNRFITNFPKISIHIIINLKIFSKCPLVVIQYTIVVFVVDFLGFPKDILVFIFVCVYLLKFQCNIFCQLQILSLYECYQLNQSAFSQFNCQLLTYYALFNRIQLFYL